MSVYFSEKFKELRKKYDLTQEQIADIFHVSPQSVSRWETGANYPDVEILPHIAILFKVTVDELLGTEKILGEEKVREYIRDIRNLLNSGKTYDAIDTARKAVKEYPVHYGLQGHLVQALTTACSGDSPEAKENTEKFKSEIITICERLINNNPEHAGHKVQLLEQYVKWGMKEEAKKILESLPSEIWYTQDANAGLVLEGEEWRKNQQNRIVRAEYLLEYLISGYLSKADLDAMRKIEYRKAKMQIMQLINTIAYDDVNDSVNHLELAFDNIILAELYCETGDAENALDFLEKATQDSLHHADQMDKTNADGSNYMAWPTPRNLCWILWEDHLAKPLFDIIRSNERFANCLELLKSNSRELK